MMPIGPMSSPTNGKPKTLKLKWDVEVVSKDVVKQEFYEWKDHAQVITKSDVNGNGGYTFF